MGLILGITVLVLGFIGSLFILFANGMASAPSSNNAIPIWPWLISCLCIGGLLILTHYYPISW